MLHVPRQSPNYTSALREGIVSLHLISDPERRKWIDALYASVKDVPHYGMKITRANMRLQIHGISMDIANSSYVIITN